MSIFSLGRSQTVAPAGYVTTGGDPWWRWNPYRAAAPAAFPEDRTVYDQGVRDDGAVRRRTRRGGHPILAFLGLVLLVVTLTAAAGVAFLGLAFQTGSFEAAGAAVDHQIAAWRSGVVGGAANVVVTGGNALTNAGQTITDSARQVSNSGR